MMFFCFLILFLLVTAVDVPSWYYKAFYKYYFEVIFYPILSTIWRVKSLTTHKNDGKWAASYPQLLVFVWISLAKFMIKFRVFKAFSSILPTEL